MGRIPIHHDMDRLAESGKEMGQWETCCVVVGSYGDYIANGNILMLVEGRERGTVGSQLMTKNGPKTDNKRTHIWIGLR